MQSLNKKKRKLYEITQARPPLSILDGKISKFNTPQKWEKKSCKMYTKLKFEHFQYVNNHCTMFE